MAPKGANLAKRIANVPKSRLLAHRGERHRMSGPWPKILWAMGTYIYKPLLGEWPIL